MEILGRIKKTVCFFFFRPTSEIEWMSDPQTFPGKKKYDTFAPTGKKYCFILKENIKLHKISLNSVDFGEFFRLKLGVLTNKIKGCLIWIGNIFVCSNTTKVFLRKSLRTLKYYFWGKLTKFFDFWDFFPLTFKIVVRFFSNSYFHMRTTYFND